MAVVRSILFNLLFYPATLLWVLAAIACSAIGERPTIAVVLSWGRMHYFLARRVLGIRSQMDGEIPPGPMLIAVKHQSMFETIEVLRLARLPAVVLKRELYDIPLFGFVTKCYGVIPVERQAGAKALRELVAHGRAAVAANRPVVIFPEGTRVPPGQTPPLQSGFAGLYRALNLPVVPIAVDSGRLWGRGLVKRSGIVTFKVGETIPAGLKRDEIEQRVHRAINAFELAP
jgi:1-acyl-sn-glycerol-3-phosphate acyltransferase